MSACVPLDKGAASLAVLLVYESKWWMIVASTSLCDFLQAFQGRRQLV
jgi:hypothetical protein